MPRRKKKTLIPIVKKIYFVYENFMLGIFIYKMKNKFGSIEKASEFILNYEKDLNQKKIEKIEKLEKSLRQKEQVLIEILMSFDMIIPKKTDITSFFDFLRSKGAKFQIEYLKVLQSLKMLIPQLAEKAKLEFKILELKEEKKEEKFEAVLRLLKAKEKKLHEEKNKKWDEEVIKEYEDYEDYENYEDYEDYEDYEEYKEYKEYEEDEVNEKLKKQ